MNKISFCTVCRNRLEYVRQTLPVNIRENAAYENVEFVLLDYNSPDGLEEWVKSEMKQHIESGILKYYKTTEPDHFKMSHSKNMALKLGSGDIITQLDADNYAGFKYAHWLNQVFSQKGKNTLVT
ncbi:MAG: glycosyltransferase, partial [Chitinophagaceae bacterium]